MSDDLKAVAIFIAVVAVLMWLMSCTPRDRMTFDEARSRIKTIK